MTDSPPSCPDPTAEINRLRRQVEDLEGALQAIRSGDVDGVMLGGGGGRAQLYSQPGADRPYQVLVEEMGAAVVTVSPEGRILFANNRLTQWLRCRRDALVGRPIAALARAEDRPHLGRLLQPGTEGKLDPRPPFPLTLLRTDGQPLALLVALTSLSIAGQPAWSLVAIPSGGPERISRPAAVMPAGPLLQRAAPAWNRDNRVRDLLRPLPVLWALLLAVFLLDLALPAGFVLFPYYWLPLIMATAMAGAVQMRALAVASLGLTLASGVHWGLLGSVAYWLRFGGLALVALVSLRLARSRQESERRRLDSEQRYQLLAENASDVVFRASVGGVTEWISPAVTPLLRWTPEQMIGRPFRRFVHPDDLSQLQKADEAFARGERMQFRLRVQEAGDGFHWVDVTARGVLNAAGGVVGIVGSWADVQAEVEAEQASDLERARLRATLDSLLDPHAVLQARRDPDGTIVDFVYVEANEAACRYNLLSREQLLGRTLLELLPAHSSTGLLDQYIQVVETGQPLLLDDIVYPHEIHGEERHFDIRAVPMGDVLSYTWRDVSERVEAARLLAASEEQFRLLAMNVSDVVIRIRDGRNQWVSPSLRGAFGWSPEDWLEQPFGRFLHPEDHPAFDAALATVAGGSPVELRQRLRASDGTWHWVRLHASPYHDAGGVIDGLVLSLRIIDAEVRAEEDLQRLARTDELTGLLNRREVLERIDSRRHQVPRSGQQTAVLFCDLDRFKSINDSYGHAAGDELLRTVAERIRRCLRSGDLAARIGGDELLVVLQGVQDLGNAVAIAEKIRIATLAPIPTTAGEVRISLSIGVTLAQPDESSDALIARADAAMYAAKQIGRNRVIPMPA